MEDCLNRSEMTPFVQPSTPGLIVKWSGSIVDIPDGWQLCNGTNGTPDLRDRFVPGAGTTYNPGDTGGAVNHTHTATTDGHSHNTNVGPDIATGPPGVQLVTDTKTDTLTTDAGNGLPTYYSLAYIQFLGI